MEKDRRLELIDNAIQKLIHDNNDKVKGFQHDNNNLKDHETQYQLALSHLLSLSTQLEVLNGEEKLEKSEASSPSEPVGSSVIEKTESENHADGEGEVDKGCKSSETEKDEIMKELKNVKRQNFLTHCLLSVVIVVTVAWQLSEVSLILKVKEGIKNPFKSFGNMLKDMVKDNVPDINGHVDKNKEDNESTSFHSLNIPEMSHIEVPNLGKD